MKYSGMTLTNGVYCPNVTFDSPITYDSLKHIKSIGTNWISIVVTQFQQQHNSTDIFPIHNHSIIGNLNHICYTAKEHELIAAINYSHSLGLKVMLKPHIDLIDDSNNWRGTIGNGMDASQWSLWFESYTKFLLYYAQIAQETRCEMLSVSTELIIVSEQEELWRTLIPKVRAVYDGILTDAAHWSWPNDSVILPSNGLGEFTDKRWWDLMDIIGVDMYYLSHVEFDETYPNLTAFINAWQPIERQLLQMANYWNKSIIFTEIGECSGYERGCTGNGNVAKIMPTNESMYSQRTFYESVLMSFTKYPFFEGIFWWNWDTDAAFGGLNDSCLTPAYKPAEGLLREWYYATEPQPPPPDYMVQCGCWF